MAKGKHSSSSAKGLDKNYREIKTEHAINFKKFLIFILLFLVIFFLLYCFVFRSNKAITSNIPSSNSNVNISKRITGLEDIEILGVTIKNSDNISSIDISFYNTSSKSILGKKANFYLLDENGSIVFGTSLKLPNMEPNSQNSLNISCSTNIKSVSDYEIDVK